MSMMQISLHLPMGGIDEVQSIAIDENSVLKENEINTDIKLNISVVDTPYNENTTIEISVIDTNTFNE